MNDILDRSRPVLRRRDAHPLADLFPLLEGQDFDELAADIGRHGLREDIVLFKGRILDGRNRYRACRTAGVEPRFKNYTGDDPLGFVISLNLHRRHLNESQRAMVAAKLANLKDGQRADLVEGLPIGRASALLNVSERSVARAREVLDHGTEELQRAVQRDDVTVSAAADIASRPAAEQREIVARGERDILNAAKEIRARKLEERRVARIARVLATADAGPLPRDRKWPLILADPAMRYVFSPTSSRAIEHHFETLPLDEICALPVREIAAPHAVLFLWMPPPLLLQARDIFDAWGFESCTGSVWVKTEEPDEHAIGLGNYFRLEHEHFLLATRGDVPPPPTSRRPPSVFYAPRPGVHSEKPDIAYEIIERMYPELGKLELFARGKARPGWRIWGNEAEDDEHNETDESEADEASVVQQATVSRSPVEIPDLPDFLDRRKRKQDR